MRKNCETYNWIDYLEGSVPDTQLKEMDDHLSICSTCAGFVDFLRGSMKEIDEEKKVEVDSQLYARVIKRLNSTPREAKIRPLYKLLGYAAILIVGVLLGQFVGRQTIFDTTSVKVAQDVNYLNELSMEPIESFLLTIEKE